MNVKIDISKEVWTRGKYFTNDGGVAILAHERDDGAKLRVCVVDSTIERTRNTAPDAPDAHRDVRIQSICAVPDLIAACQEAQCGCSPPLRDSGHISGCWMPQMIAALKKAGVEV
jgi:hypothetical protein